MDKMIIPVSKSSSVPNLALIVPLLASTPDLIAVHPIALIGATFATETPNWPSTRPEWAMAIARKLQEFEQEHMDE